MTTSLGLRCSREAIHIRLNTCIGAMITLVTFNAIFPCHAHESLSLHSCLLQQHFVSYSKLTLDSPTSTGPDLCERAVVVLLFHLASLKLWDQYTEYRCLR